jgi:hypothetical protein
LDKAAQELGLVIIQDKTKYMWVSKNSHNQCREIAARGYGMERVSTFPYVDSVINEDNRISKERTQNLKSATEPIVYFKDK